jgi:hypothetical protein
MMMLIIMMMTMMKLFSYGNFDLIESEGKLTGEI